MKFLEKVLVVLAAIGLLLKIMHVPFNGPLLVLALGSLSMFYLCMSWLLFQPRDKSGHKIWISIFVGFLFFNATYGFLFKIMFWPFSNPPMFMAFWGLLPMFILSIIKSNKEEAKKYYSDLSTRIIIVLIVVTVFLSISSKSLFAFIHRNDAKRIELYNKTQDNPLNEEYAKEFVEYAKTH